MATGQNILNRMKGKTDRPRGVLPLAAYYGRGPERERERNRMYNQVRMMMSMPEDEAVIAPPRRAKMIDFSTHIGFVDVSASPLEYLVWRGDLESPADEEGMGGLRFHTALRMRDLAAGARVNGVKTQSFSGMGGGGGGRVDVSTYQIDCIRLLGRVGEAMPEPWMGPMLEMVVVQDEWLDLRHERGAAAARRRREQTLAALLFSLDGAAVTFRYLPAVTMRKRWRQVPDMPQSLKGHVRGPMAVTRPPPTRR